MHVYGWHSRVTQTDFGSSRNECVVETVANVHFRLFRTQFVKCAYTPLK